MDEALLPVPLVDDDDELEEDDGFVACNDMAGSLILKEVVVVVVDAESTFFAVELAAEWLEPLDMVDLLAAEPTVVFRRSGGAAFYRQTLEQCKGPPL